MSQPGHPPIPEHIAQMRPSMFARVLERLAAHKGEVFGFHIGDSAELPPAHIRAAATPAAQVARNYRYGHPLGDPALRLALAQYLQVRHGLTASPEELCITTGATGALSATLTALLSPGDEVLLCAPYWPLIRGMVHMQAAVPVEVDVTQALYRSPDLDLGAVLRRHVTPRTRAIYFTSPNNPDGKVFGQRELKAIAHVARDANLWVFFDAAYIDLAFVPAPAPIATLPGMDARTITVGTFSKTFGMAGVRVGWLHAQPAAMAQIRKVANHQSYHASAVSQAMAHAALSTDEATITAAATRVRTARDACLASLSLPAFAPEGGAYVFADVSRILAGRPLVDLLQHCVDAGVVFAPGDGFGSAYGNHIRVCYTAMPLDTMARGLDRLQALLASFSSAG